MMNLGLMSRFFETADEHDVHSPLADQIASRWVDDEAAVEHRRSSANFVFTVQEAQGNRYFLRFNHSSERIVQQLEAELEYVCHLANRGIAAALPIRSSANHFIETVSTELGNFHGIMFEAASGEHCSMNEMDEKGLQSWGRALGRVHSAGESFGAASRPSWQDHITMARRLLPTAGKAALDELEYIEEYLGELPTDTGTFGLIHFDFELDNLLWEGETPGIIDFDDCAYYWYEADIAFALRDLYDDRVGNIDLASDRLLAFVGGYRMEHELSSSALARLPLFARLHNLIMCAKLYWSLGDGPMHPEPKWTTELREYLKETLRSMSRQFEQEPIRDRSV